MTDLDKEMQSIERLEAEIKATQAAYDAGNIIFTEIHKAARAHLAAQRQGGDAGGMPEQDDPEVMYLEPRCCADPNTGRQWCQDEVWADNCEDGKRGVKYIRADLTHPPAVTGDKGALDACERIENQAVMVYTSEEYDYLCEYLEIIRAALSAQGGVPGDVVEKVEAALELAIGYPALVARGVGKMPILKDRAADDCRIISEALTLLQPYLNNGRGE